LNATTTVSFGGGVFGSNLAPDYAGLTPGFAGVYQVDVRVPDDGPTGAVNVSLGFADSRSNSITIYIQ
jgi:uncharacterized protein (TIGR03437 family)